MYLLIGDLHLTDRSKDSYRFEIFDWIRRQQNKRDVAATFLAGDLTDGKDRHSATLVNHIVNGLLKLKPPVYIVMGNHDYRDPKNPFFKFLNHIEGIAFVVRPTVVTAGRSLGIIPHYRSQDEFDGAVRVLCRNSPPDGYLVHQTFDGAIAETGVRLSGLRASPIELLKPPLGVYAGDVHKPQRQGLITYLGCPYHVRFGDNYEPRALWVDRQGNHKNLYFDAPRKWSLTVRGPENLFSNENLFAGDQVKLTVEIVREELTEWKKIKQDVLKACVKLNLDVFGVKMEVNSTKPRERTKVVSTASKADVFDQFCKVENVGSKIKKVGKGLLNGNKDSL